MTLTTPNRNQVDTLLNFLEDHKQLARGQLRSAKEHIRFKQLWKQITNELNSLGGCIKTVKQWQKMWYDKKYLAKKVASNARLSAVAKGGAPSIERRELTPQEVRILAIIGEDFGKPNNYARLCQRFRRTSNVAGGSLHRLIDIEERRVAAEAQSAMELTLIRRSIKELCQTVQTNLQAMVMELKALRS